MQIIKPADQDYDMQVIHRPTRQELGQARQEKYARTRKGRATNERKKARQRIAREGAIPTFIGVDGEGVGRGKAHRYVLLGVGQEQYIARDIRRGIEYDEAFSFLYEQFRANPKASFVGFYLRYDFTRILATLPREAAWMLMSKQGKAMRKMSEKSAKRRQFHPVRVGGWEVDLLGMKRLSIRPRPEGCECYEKKTKCTHKQFPWMHICDAGPFFQMKFLSVIDPKTWKDDPDGPVCTQAQFNRIEKGKDKRATFTRITKEMMAYNVEENLLLAVVMNRLAKGFVSVGIKIPKDQWYGPGAAASAWLRSKNAPTRRQLRFKDNEANKPPLMPKWFWDICRYSYFGGWFEIFSHGIIPGETFNYDINSAYPFATLRLPHICRESHYHRGSGSYEGAGEFVLLYATVFAKGDRIGPMPNRAKNGTIRRPSVTKGWYWRHELEAARRADLVKKVMVHEWAEFDPCDHPRPLDDISDMYDLRLQSGKNSAKGLAIKNDINSVYGKFAQATGSAPYNNWLYASYITSHCRTQILDAIATHPDKANAVLMVATDGICFDSPHPLLDRGISEYLAMTGKTKDERLGQWTRTVYTDLVLFKPGVYWHHEGKEALLKVKSRGVPKDEFLEACDYAEARFRAFSYRQIYPEFIIKEWELGEAILTLSEGWPFFYVPVKFRMKSCAQALQEGQWEKAGEVQEEVFLKQDSDPSNKRRRPVWNAEKQRIDTTIYDLPIKELQTYYHLEAEYPQGRDLGVGYDGLATESMLEAFTTLRDKPANYDIPLDDIEWETIWDGGPVE